MARSAVHRSPGLSDDGALRQLRWAIVAVIALALIGCGGFMLLAGMSPGEALYMTVITLSTVGYGEVRPLDPVARAFTVVLILAGVSTAFYFAGALATFVVDGRLREVLGRRNMSRALESLENHVIVCGYGRLGRVVCTELEHAGVQFVVIEEDEGPVEHLVAAGTLALQGSAVDDELLERAGLARARTIMATTGSEAVNVFVTLAAREANPTIQILARAETEHGARRLERAGADQVVSPHRLGGLRLVGAILRPAVVESLDLLSSRGGADVNLEELLLGAGCALEGRTIEELLRAEPGLSVVAHQPQGRSVSMGPAPDVRLAAGDRVVVVGAVDKLARLAEAARAAAT